MTIQPTNVRHRVIIVSMLMAFILYLDRICLAEIVKFASFQSDVNLSKDQIGSILSIFFISYALFQIPAGWASDRFGGRTMLTAYIVLWSVFTALTGLMSTFPGLLLMRLLCGAAEAGAYPTSGAIIRRWFPLQARARASSLVAFGGRIGGTLAPLITAWLVISLGNWRAALWIDGAVGLVIAAIYWKVVRDRPDEHPKTNEGERELIGSPVGERPVTTQELGSMLAAILRSRGLWLTAATLFFINVGWAFLITWLPTYLKEQQHVEALTGGRMVTLVLALGMVGQLAGGFVADWSVGRFGLRWGRVVPLVTSGLLAGGAYLACLSMGSAWGVVFCCAGVSFAVDMGSPALWAFMQDVGGRVTAASVGFCNMFGNLGAALIARMAPWLVSLGATETEGQRIVFLVCGLALLLAGVIPLAMDATRPVQMRLRASSTLSTSRPSEENFA